MSFQQGEGKGVAFWWLVDFWTVLPYLFEEWKRTELNQGEIIGLILQVNSAKSKRLI